LAGLAVSTSMSGNSESPMHDLVGRAAQEAVLQHFAQAAAAGRGAVVLVSADTGVGKTALVDAALSRANLLDARAAAAPADTSPLGAVGALLRALRRQLPDTPVLALDGQPALAALLSATGEGQAVTSRAALFDAVGDALAAVACKRALALVLDDLQWADHTTLELIPALAGRARSAAMLIVAIYRSDAAPPGHPIRTMREALRRARLLNEVTLAPLDRRQTSQLTRRLLGREPHPALVAVIWERSGGVPLFVEALLATLRSRGELEPDAAAFGSLPLPETVRDAVVARLARLPPPAQRAAESAAVAAVGAPEFPLERLVQLNERADGIEDLLASGLLQERRPGLATFRTPLERDAVYAAVPWTRRRLLHRRAAELFEASGDETGHPAAHWEAAGEPERARKALLGAADRSRRLHAHRDSVGLLRRALDLWPPGHEEPDRLRVLDQLGDAAQLSGRFADALRAWREVADSATGAAGASCGARALRKVANLYEMNGDWARALDARHDAMSAFAASGDRAEAAIEGVNTAIRLRMSSQHGAALDVLARSAKDAALAGREDLKLRIAALEGNLEARLGRVAEGVAAIREAHGAALALDQPALVGEIYQRLADAIERAGDYRGSAAVNREGVAFCEEHALPGGVLACLACMGWVLVRSGEWDQAARTARRMLESPACAPPARSAALGFIGLVHVFRGQLRKGEPMLVESLAIARRVDHALAEMTARWGLAMHELAAGNASGAGERCAAILERYRDIDERHAAIPVLRWSASCFAQLRDHSRLRACGDVLGEAAARFASPEALSALSHALGEIALLEGDGARAASQLENALALIEDRDLPRERTESLLRAAAACAAAGRRDAAVRFARDAARNAERLGARPLEQAAFRQLRDLGAAVGGALGVRGAQRAMSGGLTARQVQILQEISRGLTDKEVARALRLSPRTVETHVAHALAALDCRTRAEAVRKATELGVLSAK
jgi:DNA-binding NarL/FixJ family response regulator